MKLMKRLHKPIYTSRIQELVRRLTEHLHSEIVCLMSVVALVNSARLSWIHRVVHRECRLRLELVSREAELIPIRHYDGREIPMPRIRSMS